MCQFDRAIVPQQTEFPKGGLYVYYKCVKCQKGFEIKGKPQECPYCGSDVGFAKITIKGPDGKKVGYVEGLGKVDNKLGAKLPLTLKQFRRKYHLTQRDLAEKIGTTTTTISKYETGQWVMNQVLIDRIFEEYGEVIRPLLRTIKKKIWQLK